MLVAGLRFRGRIGGGVVVYFVAEVAKVRRPAAAALKLPPTEKPNEGRAVDNLSLDSPISETFGRFLCCNRVVASTHGPMQD